MGVKHGSQHKRSMMMETVKQRVVSMILTLPETVNLEEIIRPLRQLQEIPIPWTPKPRRKNQSHF